MSIAQLTAPPAPPRAARPWFIASALIARGARFGLVGATCAALSYAAFIIVLRLGGGFLFGNACGWACGMATSFVLNRRFTFRVRAREDGARQFGLFTAGALVQLLITSTGYEVFMGLMHLGPTLAFALNIGLSSGLMFAYLNWVAFRAR